MGNQNAVGNKGGGRSSAYQENMDAKFLHDLWEGEIDEEKLKKIIESGKYGAKHVFAIMAMTRDPKMMGKLVDKLFANKQKIEIENPFDEEVKDHLNKLNRLINNAKASTTKTDNGSDTGEPPSC